MQERRPSANRFCLSEENLRKHNDICPTSDKNFQENLIREERARAHEREMHRTLSERDRVSHDGNRPVSVNIEVDTAYISDALKMYRGPSPSSETPMNRFITMSPTNDSHPWLVRHVMDASGISCGDLETLDLRRLAAEFISLDEFLDDTRHEGSLRPSSPTLSVPRLSRSKGTQEGTRVRKRIGLRRRNSLQQLQQATARDAQRSTQQVIRHSSGTSLDSL